MLDDGIRSWRRSQTLDLLVRIKARNNCICPELWRFSMPHKLQPTKPNHCRESIESDIDMRTRALHGYSSRDFLVSESISASLCSLPIARLNSFSAVPFSPAHCIQLKDWCSSQKQMKNLNNGLIGILCDMKFICREFFL